LAQNIVLVDDVLTQGITSIACASILKRYFSDTRLSVFAVLTTTDSVEDIYSPEKGTITLHDSLKTYKKCLGGL
jgi:adenine/guanine phosphoribosyltransferase-like PRPP-binding protein